MRNFNPLTSSEQLFTAIDPYRAELKKCNTCGNVKLISEFNNGKFRRGKMEPHHDCKVCQNISGKKWREAKLPPPIKIESLEGEEWRPISWFKGRKYEVSNYGRVKVLISRWNRDERLLIQAKSGRCDYYPHVRLFFKYKERPFTIHRLVAKAFQPNPENKPWVNHKDGDKYNFFWENLEWVTPSENAIHAVEVLKRFVSRGEHRYNAKLTNEQAVIIAASDMTTYEIMIEYPFLSASHIREIKRGVIWSSVTGIKKNKRDKEVYRQEVKKVFEYKGNGKQLCREMGISYTRYKSIRSGLSASHITGKKHSPKFLTKNQYV